MAATLQDLKINGHVYSRSSAEIALVDGTIFDAIQAADWDHSLTPGFLVAKGKRIGRTRGNEEPGDLNLTMTLKDLFALAEKLMDMSDGDGYKTVSFPVTVTWFEKTEPEELKVSFEGVRLMTDAFSLEEDEEASLVEATFTVMAVKLFKGTKEIIPVAA